MSEQSRGSGRAGRRSKRFLSPSEKYEIWLQLVRQEVTMKEGNGMRKVVLAMNTTLNGRGDDLFAWFDGVADDLYTEIDRGLASFDTILVGRVNYEGMLAYWPGAETEEGGSPINKSVAQKMNAYKKYVFSSTTADGPAVLGSIAVAGYRFALDPPAGLPSERHTGATESLVGATSAAESLDPAAAQSLVAAAREAFLSGADIALGVVAVLLAGLAVLVHRLLAHLPPTTTQQPH